MDIKTFGIDPPSGSEIPRGATSFYDFSQNDDGGQPGATSTQDGEENGTPAPPSLATPTLNGNSGSSSSSTSTPTTTVTSPYAQFNGSNYDELEKYLRSQMESVKPETDEEREKRERREKRIGFLARLADGLGTFHTAFSHVRGEKPMDMPAMSAKARERFEKARLAREKDRDRLANYALSLGKIGDSDRLFKFRVAQAEQQQRNADRLYDADREDKARRLEIEAKVADARAAAYEAQGDVYAAQAERDKAQARRLEAQAALDDERAKWVGPQAQSVIDKNEAQGAASRITANSVAGRNDAQRDLYNRTDPNRGRSGGGGNAGGKSAPYYGSFLGVDYKTAADYERSVKSAASRYGIKTVEHDIDGKPHPRSVSEIAADVESAAAKKKPLPGRGGGKKPLPGK